MDESDKIIIVEGLSDKRHIEKIMSETVDIVCTNGTFSYHKFDELLEDYDLDDRQVYILVDEDRPGQKLRKQLARELPHAEHIYIDEAYREVADVPINIIAQLLFEKKFEIDTNYLL